MLQNLRKEMDVVAYCDDWWDITDPQRYSIYKLPMFFKDEEMRKQIDIAQKLEVVTISLIQFIGILADKSILVPIKNLVFYVH